MQPNENPKHKNDLEAIVQTAEEEGYISLDQLFSLNYEDNPRFNEMREVVEFLQSRGVKIVGPRRKMSTHSIDDDYLKANQEFFNLDDISIDDSVTLYMKEMSAVPLLSMEEEINLAKRIRRSSKARMELAGSNGRLDENSRKEFALCIQDGFKARERLIKANTRLVVSIARRYLGRGVPLLDLIQEGNMGLMRAVEKYEYERGYRFSTYATWWIRQSVSRAVAYQSRTIRVPVHMFDRLRNLYIVSRDFEQQYGRLPSPKELADIMELDVSKIRWMLEVAQSPVSLDSPIGDDEDTEFGSLVKDESSLTPAQVTYQNMLRERVDEVLATLSPREARVLRLRFGLGHERAYTLEEVGRKFGLTRERIRQIEGKALRRLRQPNCASLLRDYI